MASYSRYRNFQENGRVKFVPFIKLSHKDSDKYELYETGKSRLDVISYKYYQDPNFGWLILQANPEYGSLEFNIPDQTWLRIPYPLNASLRDYEEGIKLHKELYGDT